jgi:hypothetical protein
LTWKAPFIALSLLAATAHAQSAGAAGEVLDRAVAQVDGRVITQSELEFEARVALVRAGGVEAAFAPLDDSALKDALDLAIGQRLEEREADKLQAYPLDEGEVEAAVTAFKARFPAAPEYERFLARYEADAQQVAAILGRSLRTAKILDGKLRLRAQVSEAEVRRAYDRSAADLSPATYEELREPLRQKLVSERMKQLTAAELVLVRRGADVRLIAPFARAPKRATP